MPAQNRRILPPDDTHAFPREARDYCPGADREAMRRVVPSDDGEGVVVRWGARNPRGQLELLIGIPGGETEIRVFPEQKARDAVIKAIPMDVAPNHRIAAWWDPKPSDENAGEMVCTLHIGLIRDENAPKIIGGDGLDEMPKKKLLTIAGTEMAHDVKKEMLVPEIIERIRANRLAPKKEPALESATA